MNNKTDKWKGNCMSKVEEGILVDGQKCSDVCNPFSRFPEDPLSLECDAFNCRVFMKPETVTSMLNEFVFRAVQKTKRVNARTYLEVDWEATEALRRETGDGN
jgi:hypothetical protein